jgi:hypothetical protein
MIPSNPVYRPKSEQAHHQESFPIATYLAGEVGVCYKLLSESNACLLLVGSDLGLIFGLFGFEILPNATASASVITYSSLKVGQIFGITKASNRSPIPSCG